MLPAISAIIAIASAVLLHRRSRGAAWWIGGAIALYALVSFIVVKTSDTPSEVMFARLYDAGEISYNGWLRGSAAARHVDDVGALIAGALTIVCVGLGFILERDARARFAAAHEHS